MKRVRCPKCDGYITFDDSLYTPGQRLVFECPDCNKQFGIRLHTVADGQTGRPADEPVGHIVVVENVFHFRQEIPLSMGDNVIGRHVRGCDINTPIETVDPSVDTKHCIITVKRDRHGGLQYLLRDAPSNTGTFVAGDILRDSERAPITDGSVITIGATTLILRTEGKKDGEDVGS